MLASLAADAIRYTITGSAAAGAMAGTPGTELQIINEALQALARRYPWRWLTRTTQPLALVGGQPWVDLPRDFDEMIALVRGPGLLTWMEPGTEQELAEFRAGAALTGDPFGHYYLVEHVEHFNPNALVSSEVFSASEWLATNVTVGAGGGTSPEGVNDATVLTGTTTAGTLVQELTISPTAEDRRTYVASLFVKAGTSAASELALRQAGAGGETTGGSPLTTLRVTWAAGVPSVAVQTSQGVGAHDVGVEARADGWYRIWCLLTLDLDRALPSRSLFYVIRPAVLVAGTTLLVWGAQLEQHAGSHVDSTQIVPSRYRPDDDQPATALRRQLAIWPTPATTQPNAFLLRYRSKPAEVTSENTQISLPWYLETILLEACRHVARGWHSEDIGTVTERLAGLWQTPDFLHAIERDDDAQRELGPMRGTAASALGRGGCMNWAGGSVVNPPGALA